MRLALLLVLAGCGTGPPRIYAAPVRIYLVLTPNWEDLQRHHFAVCDTARRTPELFPDLLEECALYGLTTAREPRTRR